MKDGGEGAGSMIAVFQDLFGYSTAGFILGFLKYPGAFVSFCVFLKETPQSRGKSMDFTAHEFQFENHSQLNNKLVEWSEDREI